MNISTDPARVLERFWRYVDKGDDCWNWTGQLLRGYGKFQFPNGQLAHRFAYEMEHGPIPEGMTVDHLCFNPSCVRPDHLRLLTRKENAENQKSKLATHCAAGHEYTPQNTAIVRNRSRYGDYRHTSRRCRTCANARKLAWKRARHIKKMEE